jgi:hypothetical protein
MRKIGGASGRLITPRPRRGNGFGGDRIDVHEDTAALLTRLIASQ